VNLSKDGKEVWAHCCLKWLAVKDCLWFPTDNDTLEIHCPEHEAVILGYDYDLPALQQ
jgi:hypothetical protein